MAVQTAVIKSITSVEEPSMAGAILGANVCHAKITVALPITGGADTCILGGTAGGAALFGLAATATLSAVIQAFRRDGKTVALMPVSAACAGEAGLTGGTRFFAQTFAVSGQNLTFNCTNLAGAQIAAPAGVGLGAADLPMTIYVSYTV